MRTAGRDAQSLKRTVLRSTGGSVLALVAFASVAAAGERVTTRDPRCVAAGEGSGSVQGLDGCFAAGSHVRVESQVMQGSARMSGALPFASDGAAPAAMRSDGATTHLRMRPGSGDIFAR